jgi:hypothetical protein
MAKSSKREEYDRLAAEMKADWDKATRGTAGKCQDDPPEDEWRAAVAKAAADEAKLNAIFG